MGVSAQLVFGPGRAGVSPWGPVQVVLLCAALLLPPSQAGAQRRVIPQGQEPRVSALILRGEEAPLSLPVTGVQIESQRILVTLREGAGVVALGARSARFDGEPLGRSSSFSFWLLVGSERADVRRAASELRERVRARDDGTFWGRAVVVSDGAERPRSSMSSRRTIFWLALAGLLGWLVFVHRAQVRARALVAPSLAFGVALLLRLTLPPWAPLHANDHGISELRGLVGRVHGMRPHEADLYGEAHGELMRFLVGPTGLGSDGVLLLGAIFGAASVPLLYGLARRLVPDRPAAGALAALALAFHPAHIRLSLSESPRPLAMSLLILALGLGLLALRSRAPRVAAAACLASALALALAVELRVMTLIYPATALAFVLIAAWRRPSRLPWPAALLALALLAWVVRDHTAALLPALRAGGQRISHLGQLLRPPELLLHPDLTPLTLAPLSLVGAVLLFRDGRRREVAACVAALALLVPSGLLIIACRTDWVRYQTDSQLPLMLLVAGLASPTAARVRRWLLPISALALLLASAPGLVDLTRPDVHAQAYAIARRAPRGGDIIAGPIEMASEPRVRAEFPDYLLEDPSRVREAPREGAACVNWIGVGCWSFARDEPAAAFDLEGLGPFRAECLARLGGEAAAGQALRRLSAVDVPHRDQEFHRIQARNPRVGFVPCPR